MMVVIGLVFGRCVMRFLSSLISVCLEVGMLRMCFSWLIVIRMLEVVMNFVIIGCDRKLVRNLRCSRFIRVSIRFDRKVSVIVVVMYLVVFDSVRLLIVVVVISEMIVIGLIVSVCEVLKIV